MDKSCRVLGAFVLMFGFAPSEQSHDRGRLVYTDHAGDVYVYDFSQNSPQSITEHFRLTRGSAWIIDEDFVLVQMCFYPPSEFLCPRVRQIVGRQDTNRFNAAYEFWQVDYDNPVWSPDGNSIAFLKAVIEPDSPYPKSWNFHLINADGTEMRDPTPDDDDDRFAFVWSPDSQEIAYRCGIQNYFCIVNTDATQLRKIEVKAYADIYELAWSPDGSLIASLLFYEDPRHYELYIMNSDGSNPRLLWDTETQLSNLTWSPDSTHVVVAARILSDAVSYNIQDIYVVPVNGDNPLNLTNTESVFEYSPTWSPDSSQIAYFSEDGGTSLYIVNTDGGSAPQLIHDNLPYATDSPNPSVFWIP